MKHGFLRKNSKQGKNLPGLNSDIKMMINQKMQADYLDYNLNRDMTTKEDSRVHLSTEQITNQSPENY